MKKAIWHLVITTLSLAAGWQAQASAPIDLGSRLELFVDRFLIDQLSGTVHLELHEPRDEGVALTFEKPWEGVYSHYATVIQDGSKYRMYYRGLPWVDPEEHAHHSDAQRPEVTCYAESTDGIHWTKPELGLFEVNGTKANNVILAGPRPLSHNFSPFLDTNPNAPKDQRYKALSGGDNNSGTGLVAFVSPDGIHWRKLQEQPVFPWKKEDMGLDSQNVAFWSELEQTYVLYYRYTFQYPVSDKKYNLRAIGRATSGDFVHWSDGTLMTYSDTGNTTPSNQFYTNQTSPYFRAPQIYLATAARFMPDRQVVTDEQAKQVKVVPGFQHDCSDAVLMTSRGGTQYDRTFMDALIKPMIGPSHWTSRSNYPARNIVQTGDTEISLYVNDDVMQPTAHLERYSWRLDGLASLHADHEGGDMVTKPLTFKGNRLLLNFATSAAGGIRVEIQDADGKPLPGFALTDCSEVIGNEIERPVTWKTGDDLSGLSGKTVRLRFAMNEADLYSLKFQ